MELNLVTPPTEEPLTLDEVRWYLKLPSTREDDHVKSLISSARAYVEGTTGRALIKQKWKLRFKPPYPKKSPLIKREEDTLKIHLPYPPLLSVEEVKMKEQPIPFRVEENDVFLSSFCWEKDISISFWAGYGDTKEALPPNLKMGTLMATSLFENHDPIDLSLLNPFKVFHII